MPVIVGVGRSGTTLLRLMMDAHPKLAIPPETGFLLDAAQLGGEPPELREGLFKAITAAKTWRQMQVSQEEFRERLDAVEPFDLGAGIRAFYRMYAWRFAKPRWGDKTPYYLTRLDEIEGLLPEAHFIHVIRDGRDVAISMRGLWFSPGDDMESIARHWVQAIRAAQRLGADRRRYLEVRYEALVSNPTSELRRICDFIEIEFDSRMEQYSATARNRLREMVPPGMMDRPSHELPDVIRFATGPPEPSRVQRWRHDMDKRDRIHFERVAWPLLAELGYETTIAPHHRLLARARRIFRS